jgi:DNA-binding transcriptional ArsR family regulator
MATAPVSGEGRFLPYPWPSSTLGHPARIRILELLSERDHADHQLLDQITIEPSNLSQQLAVLRRAGLIVHGREAGEVVCSIGTPEIRDLSMTARRILPRVFSEQDELKARLVPAWARLR